MKSFIKSFLINRVFKRVYNFYSSISTIHLRPLILKESDRVLILAPHADDEVIGCGGLLLNYSDICDVIALTDGRYGDSKIESDKMAEIRKNEFSSVMKKLEVKNFSILGIEDGMLKESYEEFIKINFSNYSYIFIPNNLDQHPDHKAVFEHIIRAYRENRIKKDTKLAMYEVWGALTMPNYYIDISDLAEQKKELINMHKSQVKEYDYANRILALNYYRGLIASNKEYVESYFILDIDYFSKLIVNL